MPKLLIINITCNQGSTGKISEQVGLMMQERGWDVYYAHGARRVNPSQLKTIPFSSVGNEYIHALRSLLLDADGLGSANATKRLVEHIKKIQPDVIQIHNIHGYYLNIGILFKYLNSTNIPIVMTLHDCWTFTGHCTHFCTVGCERWKTGCHDCPLTTSMPKKSLIDRSRRNYALKKKMIAANMNVNIVTVSDWMAGIVRQSMYKYHRLRVIKNGIDLNVFQPRTATELKKKFIILGVSNVWDKAKGFYDIIKLRQLLPEDIEIRLVGVSQKQISMVPEGITGIINTSNQAELAEMYSDADVLLNPTYADTYPTVNLEAIACGTPVITYDTGGSPESITDDTGMVVNKGDVKRLATEILSMRDNNYKANTTKACRDYALHHFENISCFTEYVSLYEELVNNRQI